MTTKKKAPSSTPTLRRPIPWTPPPKASMLAIVNQKYLKNELESHQFKGQLGEVFGWGTYESNNHHLAKLHSGSLFLVAVRPGDVLWLVAVYEKTKLMPNGIESLDENITPITDITHLKGKLTFVSGNGIRGEPGMLGQELQTPRILTVADEKLLRDAVTTPIEEKQDEEDEELSGFEGEKKKYFVTHRTRERKFRDAKIKAFKKAHGTLYCEVPGCSFDFSATYGEMGQDYIQVHHIKPLSEREVPEHTPPNELVLVCANCHVMIHRGGQCRSYEGLLLIKTKPKQPVKVIEHTAGFSFKENAHTKIPDNKELIATGMFTNSFARRALETLQKDPSQGMSVLVDGLKPAWIGSGVSKYSRARAEARWLSLFEYLEQQGHIEEHKTPGYIHPKDIQFGKIEKIPATNAEYAETGLANKDARRVLRLIQTNPEKTLAQLADEIFNKQGVWDDSDGDKYTTHKGVGELITILEAAQAKGHVKNKSLRNET
jgi:hypothetical protein